MIKEITDWFCSLCEGLRRVIKQLSDMLFLFLCLKKVITELNYDFLFSSVSELRSKRSKIFLQPNLLYHKLVIMVIKVDFSSCSVSKKWSKRSSESIFDLLYLKAVIRMFKLECFLTLSQCCDQRAQNMLILPTLTLTSDQRAQRCFSTYTSFQRTDQGAQWGILIRAVSKRWSKSSNIDILLSVSHSSDQRAHELILINYDSE